jgi:hypothetical protein
VNGSNCAQSEARPSTPIEDVIDNLEGNIEGLHDTISGIERAFGKVLTSKPPKSDAGCEKVLTGVADESDLLAKIKALKNRVVLANARMLELIDRNQL